MPNISIRFMCRKCESAVSVVVSEDATVRDVAGKLKKLAATDCPTCGEEPYMNWMLDSVTVPRKQTQRGGKSHDE